MEQNMSIVVRIISNILNSRFFKYGLGFLIVTRASRSTTAIAGAVYVGYATWAYSLDEVMEKTKALREAALYTPTVDTPSFERFKRGFYSGLVSAPAGYVSLYLVLRGQIEERLQARLPSKKFLPDLHPAEQHVFTLVLDLKETLLNYTCKIFGGLQVLRNPVADYFLARLGNLYEIVVYSDESQLLLESLCRTLDNKNDIQYILSRGATKYHDGKYYRDLSRINRNPAKVLYVSGCTFKTCLQPENCIQIKPFKSRASTHQALAELIPFLEHVARNRPADIRSVIQSYGLKNVAEDFVQPSYQGGESVQLGMYMETTRTRREEITRLQNELNNLRSMFTEMQGQYNEMISEVKNRFAEDMPSIVGCIGQYDEMISGIQNRFAADRPSMVGRIGFERVHTNIDRGSQA